VSFTIAQEMRVSKDNIMSKLVIPNGEIFVTKILNSLPLELLELVTIMSKGVANMVEILELYIQRVRDQSQVVSVPLVS